jgi:hypothetical protein
LEKKKFDPNEIIMGNEFYSIDVIIEVAETQTNFQRGNVYI